MAKSPVKTRVATSARRIQVRRSGIHGRGVYATAPIAAGERIVEYTGELIDWDEAMDRHPQNPDDPFHTFYFGIDDHWVIDANFGGNSARWINHACDPNCETEIVGKKVYIFALRDIEAGEELFYDYGLTIDERHTPKLKAQYACRCGAEQCRGTMLAPKRRSRASRG